MPTRDQYFAAADKVGAAQGLSADKIKVVKATIQAESGWSGPGDSGLSWGPFQFYGGGGMLAGFAAFLGIPQSQAGPIAQNDPEKALTWALQPGGYYREVLDRGWNGGLRGGDLAYYVQANAQRSANNAQFGNTWQRAKDIYNQLWGDAPSIPLPVQIPGQVQTPGQITDDPATVGSSPGGSLDFSSSVGFVFTKILLIIVAIVFFLLGIYLLGNGNKTINIDASALAGTVKSAAKDGLIE